MQFHNKNISKPQLDPIPVAEHNTELGRVIHNVNTNTYMYRMKLIVRKK